MMVAAARASAGRGVTVTAAGTSAGHGVASGEKG